MSATVHGARLPSRTSLELQPDKRIDVIDVWEQAPAASNPARVPAHAYCSLHTTAGFLEQTLVSRLTNADVGIGPYIHAFKKLFPEGAGYRHDDLQLRQELSDAQRDREPRNADAHLAFIAAGLRTCVRSANRPGEAVYFVDLDGVNGDERRRRQMRMVGFNTEEVVARERLRVPTSSHPLDSVNLKGADVGLYPFVQELVACHGVTKGGCVSASRPANTMRG